MDEVVYELDAVKAKRLADVARHKESVEIISREVAHLEEALLKAKAAHMKSVQDVKRYEEKLRVLEVAVEEAQNMSEEKRKEKEKESKQLMGRFLSAFESTPEQERDKCLKKLAKHEAEMHAKSNDIATKKKWLLDAITKRDEIYAEVGYTFGLCDVKTTNCFFTINLSGIVGIRNGRENSITMHRESSQKIL
jgi:hypothetical protein